MKYYVIKNKKTIKLLRKHRIKNGHTPTPKNIWERIYNEIGIPKIGVPMSILANCDAEGATGHTYVVEGVNGAKQFRRLAVEDIAKLPIDLQDIIFEVRSSTEELNGISYSAGMVDGNGTVRIVHKTDFK